MDLKIHLLFYCKLTDLTQKLLLCSCDIENAEMILERDHYSMEKVKKRILEYLAVNMLKSEVQKENVSFNFLAFIYLFLIIKFLVCFLNLVLKKA